MKLTNRIRCMMLLIFRVLCMETIGQTVSHDLWNNTVFHILKDSRGLMWMGGNSVISFDGISFKEHTMETDTYGFGQTGYYICELDNGLMATGNRQGLYVTNHKDECSKVDEQITGVTSIQKLKDGNSSIVAVGCRQGVWFYDADLHQKLGSVLVNKGSVIELENAIVAMATDGKHHLWAINNYGTLLHYDSRTGKSNTFKLPRTLLTGSVNDLAIKGDQLYIASANNGLLVFNTQSHSTIRSTQIEAPVIRQIRNFNDSLYVCTDGSGAFLLTDHSVFQLKTESNTVYSVYHDSKLNIDWFGYYRSGFSYTQRGKQLFNTYKYKDFTTEGLFVRSFCKRDQQILLGTRDGAYFIDEQRDIVRHYTPKEIGGAIILDVTYFGGRYILANYEHGLYAIDPITLKLNTIEMRERLQQASYSRLVLSPDGKKLYAASNAGLIVLDRNLHLIEEHNETQSDFFTSYIYDIAFDSSGKLWISTLNGVCLYNPETNRIQSEGFPQGFFNKEPNLCFNMMPGGQMVAASEQALFTTATNLSTFERHDVFNRLGLGYVNFVQTLNVEGEKRYLLGTDRGLFLFDDQFQSFIQYGLYDGLPSLQFNRDDCFLDHDGCLWMPSTNGLVCLPKKNWQRLIAPLLTNGFVIHYSIDGKSNTIHTFESDGNSIEMDWNFASKELVVSPSTLDYHPSASSRYYEWSIDGGESFTAFDKHPITLTHLKLGVHYLRIRIAGHPETETEVKIRVLPSLMLYMELLLLLGLMAVILISVRLHGRQVQLMELIRQKHQLELQLASHHAVSDHIKASEEERMKHEEQKKMEKMEQLKYRSQSFKELERRVKKYMEEEQPYLRSNLRISDVAARMGTNVATLSQLFNDYLHTSFYDFINLYRLKEFKRRVHADDNKDFTITAISEMCGFKRSTFFATFKKFENCTPNEWIEKNNKC